jgi:hypothetical protein
VLTFADRGVSRGQLGRLQHLISKSLYSLSRILNYSNFVYLCKHYKLCCKKARDWKRIGKGKRMKEKKDKKELSGKK